SGKTRFLIRYGVCLDPFRCAAGNGVQNLIEAQTSHGGVTMKRVQILGLFIGALLLVGYEPAAEAIPASAPGIAAAFVESDGLVVKTATAGQARRVSRRMARRTSRRN